MTIQDFPPKNYVERQKSPTIVRTTQITYTYTSPGDDGSHIIYPFGATFTAVASAEDCCGNLWYRVKGREPEWVSASDVEVMGPAEAEELLDARTIARRLAKLRRSLAHEQGGWSLDDQALMWDVAKTLGLSPIQCAYVAGDPEAMWAAAEEELGL